MEFEDDTIAWDHATGLIDALAPELERRNLPPTCFASVLPGALVALDHVNDACGAMAWSRVGSVFPSTIFPVQDQTPHRWGITGAMTYELGIIRGMELPDSGEAPTAEQQFETARLQMADMKAILVTICGYFSSVGVPFIVGSYVPVGPDGGAVGGAWTVTAGKAR